MRYRDTSSTTASSAAWSARIRSGGCRKELTRKVLHAHAAECNYRLVQCEGCEAEMVYARLAMHQKRRRCVEGKLLSQRVRSASTAMKQVREHMEHLKKEAVTLDGEITRLKSIKLEERGRLKSAPPRMSMSSSRKSRPWSSKSAISTTSSSSKSTSRSLLKMTPVFMTDTMSFDVTPPNAMSNSSSSRSSPRPESSGQEEDVESMVVVAVGGKASQSRSETRGWRDNRAEPTILCKRCGKTFQPSNNHDKACRWHRGVSDEQEIFYNQNIINEWYTIGIP